MKHAAYKTSHIYRTGLKLRRKDISIKLVAMENKKKVIFSISNTKFRSKSLQYCIIKFINCAVIVTEYYLHQSIVDLKNMYWFGLRMYSHDCLVSSFNNEMQVVHYLTGLAILEGVLGIEAMTLY